MNILVIADEEAPSLWDYFRPEKLKDVDLILSCGDLNPKYLSFLATFCKGRYSMYTAITMTVTRKLRPRGAFA